MKPSNIEIECAARGVHMFIEKPLSCHPVSEVDAVNVHVQEAVKNGLVVSVGYMFRYSRAVLKMKEIIQEHGDIKAFNARYLCAYTPIDKPVWWDVDRSGGPIVEQGTHFCDLARFLGGDVDLDTLQAMSIKQTDKAGKLAHIPERINEEALAPEKRVPRVTTAFWKFKNGAIGSFMHGVLMHELKYETELEVWGDGYRLQLIDPYGKCQLGVRLPHSEETVIQDFGTDDPYYSEDIAFMRAVQHAVSHSPLNDHIDSRNPHTSGILSPYEDSVGTYKLTWAIRTKSEQNSA
jgi:predicted dehydrogenase